MSWELRDPHRDEDDDCGCRTSATCADHLAETDLTLPYTPFGPQVRARALPVELASVLRDVPDSPWTRLRRLVAA